jgi:aminoglycoside 6'-N-acetyltransferase I
MPRANSAAILASRLRPYLVPTMSLLRIRSAEPSDAEAWAVLRTELWPEAPEDHPREIAQFFAEPPEHAVCFVAESQAGELVGIVEVGLRRYAEGCVTSPVGYLEGIYVKPGHRRAGVGRSLVRAGEAWARDRGCSEMASDRSLDNDASGAFHVAAGFDEAHRIVCYRKAL